MEPHSAVAVWDSDGLTVYSGNQGANLQAAELAGALDIDPSSVHAVNPFVGGAFGGKGRTSAPAFLAAAAARALDRPIKAALSREQVFTATAGRAATVQKIALGADTDGTLIAVRHDSWCSTAADRSFVEPTSYGTSREWYATPNLAISQKMVPLNIPPTTFMRAPGEAPGSFALESAIDELAVALNMDPIELRLRNRLDRAARQGPAVVEQASRRVLPGRRGPVRLGEPHAARPHRRRLARGSRHGHRDVPRLAVPGHGRGHAAGGRHGRGRDQRRGPGNRPADRAVPGGSRIAGHLAGPDHAAAGRLGAPTRRHVRRLDRYGERGFGHHDRRDRR